MAFSGYLIKVGGANGTPLPMKYIKAEGYEITPNQRMEAEAKRSITGVLYRSTVPHTASKIEFNTPNMTNTDVEAMMTLLMDACAQTGNVLERKLKLEYYDMETNSYKTGDFYIPDIKFQISRVNGTKIIYRETRIAFIEY